MSAHKISSWQDEYKNKTYRFYSDGKRMFYVMSDKKPHTREQAHMSSPPKTKKTKTRKWVDRLATLIILGIQRAEQWSLKK